ncbi:hypothetical protein MCUN1_000903 [Malassezia cuniculi]|uniref:Major facilitator superfamily (MFS) profile domain-containing protein n=1 Tax=Malassezia cuniculi TaxID=948313 RepID=A0AAF0EP95_9BASI|nr:hypothetical protein MCUN1_000903 [Malassezia cuniculi]
MSPAHEDPVPYEAGLEEEVVKETEVKEELPVEWERDPPKSGIAAVGLIFACGTALFSDGYVNASSGPAMTIITGYIIPSHPNNSGFSDQDISDFKSRFSALVFAGTMLGMLVFGFLSDRIGRKFGMIFASLWLTLWSVIIAGAWGANNSLRGMLAALEAYRFLQGIAIGAEYPAGSVAASENSESANIKRSRQQLYFILATNTMIDWGFVFAPLVAFILYHIFGPGHLEWVWRLTLGLGAIPPLLVLFFRFSMEEPEHFRNGAIKKNVPWGLVLYRYGFRLFIVCIVWFIYDYVAYPSGIYSSMFLKKVNPNEDLGDNLGWTTLLNLFYIPGTMFGALVSQWIGPKYTIIIGTALQGVLAFVMAGAYENVTNTTAGTIIVYGLFLAFGEFGLGNNLGLLASKSIGPTAVRGTFYGIAAAIGKVGAFSGSYAYPAIQDDFGGSDTTMGNAGLFYIAGALAFFACALVFLFVPEVRADGMREEDEKFMLYLHEHGYDMSNVGLSKESDVDSLEGKVPANTGTTTGATPVTV